MSYTQKDYLMSGHKRVKINEDISLEDYLVERYDVYVHICGKNGKPLSMKEWLNLSYP